MGRRSPKCECGDPKRVGAEACDRCAALDGGSVPEATLINTLRALGGQATTEAIMVESGWSYRQTRRAAARLEASGRVIRIEDGRHGTHKNVPLLVLAEVTSTVAAAWRQLALPRCDAYLVESKGAGSPRTVTVRRAPRRGRRAPRMEQMTMRFGRRRKTADADERRAA